MKMQELIERTERDLRTEVTDLQHDLNRILNALDYGFHLPTVYTASDGSKIDQLMALRATYIEIKRMNGEQ